MLGGGPTTPQDYPEKTGFARRRERECGHGRHWADTNRRPSMPSEQVRKILARAARLAAALNRSPGERGKILQGLVEKIIVAEDTITIRMRGLYLLGGDLASSIAESASDTRIELAAAVAFKRRGVATKLVLSGLAQRNHSARCDPALIKAIARGRAWFEELAAGR